MTPVRSEGLGRWVLAPWLAGAGIFAGAVVFLPRVDCEGPGTAGVTPGRVAFVAFSVVVIAALVLGAAYRIRRLWLAGWFGNPWEWTLVGTVVAVGVLLALAILTGFGHRHHVWRLMLIGFVLAFACWLFSFVAMAMGRRADEVGTLVPVMLLLVAGFVCFPMTVIILGLNEGALC